MESSDLLSKFKLVKAFVFDIDGVFTNSHLYLLENGELMRAMNAKDGYAIKCALDSGYPIAIISGGRSEALKLRFQNLGVRFIYLGQENKLEALDEFIALYNLTYNELLYMGDDLPDAACLNKVGLATCPADAAVEIKEIANYIARKNGGEGCVREVIEMVLKLNNQWNIS